MAPTMKLETRNAKRETPEILAVIMARGGSVGLPGKALRPLLGKPIITYSFEHAKQSELITRTIVSSDDPAILALAAEHDLEPLARPAELASSTSATDPVLRHAIKTLCPTPSTLPLLTVMLYGNIPIRNNDMIDRAIQMLLDTNADSVQTIAPVGKFHPYWMFDHTGNGQIKKHIPNNIFRRQDLPPLYSPTGSVYVMKTSVLMAAEGSTDPHAFLGTDRRGLIINPEDAADIDSEKDLYIAEAILRANQTKPPRHQDTKKEMQTQPA
jgi:N-acylneuraminate cytidylyltransferase